MKPIYAAFRNDPRFAMIGISLDYRPAVAAETARQRLYAWPQGYFADHLNKRITLDELEAWGSYAVLIIDEHGKLVARNPAPDSIETTVAHMLH